MRIRLATHQQKSAHTSADRFVPLDPDAWTDHLLAQEEARHRAPFLPYIRLFCGEFYEKARVATSTGQLYDKGTTKHFSLEESDAIRAATREWLLSPDCEALWGILQVAGAHLWPYSRFKTKLERAMKAGIQLDAPGINPRVSRCAPGRAA